MLLLFFFAIVWLRIDYEEKVLNKKAGVKPKKPDEDYPVYYKARC